MDPDLRDLLSAWLGGDVAADRRADLLARLRADAAFRRAFVDEVNMLSMLKAVQSAEPRWLLLEDELGWSAADRAAGDALEDRVMRDIHALPGRRRRVGPWAWGAVAAAVLAAGLLVPLWTRPRPEHSVVVRSPEPPPYVAVLVKADGPQWESWDGPRPADGSPLRSGPLRLRAGRVTLTFFNGVMLSLQGPADVDLLSVDRVFCRRGQLRARVPPGAEGFAVLAPGSAVVDLGTEFGLNVAADGKAELMVFEGTAEVSLLNAEGHTVRSEELRGRAAVEVDPGAGRIRDVAPEPGRFVVAPELVPPALALAPAYPAAVHAARPWGYWRFEALTGGVVPNEVPGGPPLRAAATVHLAGAPGENHAAVFPPGRPDQSLVMDDFWAPPRAAGYAVELWAMAEGFNVGTLVSLTADPDGPGKGHIFLMELMGRSRKLMHEACAVRAVDRWPPGGTGGVNVFSRGMYIPYHWHHLVAQKAEDRLELYMDGDLVAQTPAAPDAAPAPCRLLVGRLKQGPQPDMDQIRPFVGRLDELAVYDHPLSAADIRRHADLTTAGGAGR
jgi:hypothetical protein